MPNVFTFLRGNIFVADGKYYRMKTDTWIDGIGFTVSQVVKLEDAIQQFDITTKTGVYDPVTDSYAGTVIPDVSCFVEPMIKDYEFVTPAFSEIEAGDKAISTLEVVKVNDMFGSFRILSVREFGGWRTCHCRFEND
jgi:hypothetical protein